MYALRSLNVKGSRRLARLLHACRVVSAQREEHAPAEPPATDAVIEPLLASCSALASQDCDADTG